MAAAATDGDMFLHLQRFRLATKSDLTCCNFIVIVGGGRGTHTTRDSGKILGLYGIPLSGHLRHQAINIALVTRYFEKGNSETRLLILNHPSSVRAWWASQEPENIVWFYGISTLVGYLMPNPIYTYKRICQQIGCR